MSKLRVEFWKYSSRNRQGHKYHPMTHVRREAILIHWAAGWTEDAIAERLHIDVDTVGCHLRQARKAGDPRAEIRHTVTVYRRRKAEAVDGELPPPRLTATTIKRSGGSFDDVTVAVKA